MPTINSLALLMTVSDSRSALGDFQAFQILLTLSTKILLTFFCSLGLDDKFLLLLASKLCLRSVMCHFSLVNLFDMQFHIDNSDSILITVALNLFTPQKSGELVTKCLDICWIFFSPDTVFELLFLNFISSFNDVDISLSFSRLSDSRVKTD